MEPSQKRTRVAVIGTGLAGLSTAYLLAQAHAARADGERLAFDVHLFERSNALGMDTASLSVKDDRGAYRVDVPMRSINGGSHSRVHQLYKRLKVPLVESDFTYAFSRIAYLASEPSSPASSDSPDPSLPGTPPPEYREANVPSRAPTPPHLETVDTLEEVKAPPRPSQTAALLYEGASGLRFPPASLPSRLHSAPLQARASYCLGVAQVALAYLYLVALALFYCALGLAYPTASPSRSTSLSTRITSFVLALVPLQNIASEPLLAWCARHRLPRRFSEDVLVPLMAAVATVGVVEARTMPAGEVLQYIASTLFASHYVTHPSFGVRGIVAALVAPIPSERVHLGVEITRLERLPAGEGYRLHYRAEADADEDVAVEFEHIVFATQADQAARLLATLASVPKPEEDSLAATRADLAAFTYVRTLVVTHTDASVLPPDARDRRDLNLAVFAPTPAADSDSESGWDEGRGYLPPTSVQTTHVLSTDAHSKPILQTTNPLVPIPAAHTLASTWFSRAFVTPHSQRAVARLAARQGAERVWFAGSYLARGIPLLEGCVTSAETVARGLIEREGGTVQRWAF